MIDFAHVWDAGEGARAGCDEGYLRGLDTLERALRALLLEETIIL
jgi:endonuclease IV